MKVIGKTVLVLLVLLVSLGWGQREGRRLPLSAWIKSAKIEIISGKPERYQNAIAYLDTSFAQYGPHSEGLYWMTQIYVDGIDVTAGPHAKLLYVERYVAYADSLHQCCASKEIKKKYKKDCDDYLTKIDSTSVKFWREFYNAGIDQLNYAKDLDEDIKTETDSVSRGFLENSLTANIDSCKANMKLCIVVNPEDYRAYLAIGNIYELENEYEQAIEWLEKGLQKTSERGDLLLMIAYDYVAMDRYCDAIPYMKEHVDAVVDAPTADDLTTMYNLSICYNNCKMYDSALSVYGIILRHDPQNSAVLTGVGRYYLEKGRIARDSTSFHQGQGDTDNEQAWLVRVDAAFDSALVYFGQTFELEPDDTDAAEDYAIVAAIRQKWTEAAGAFGKLTELEPDNKEHWVSLGDCHLYLLQFAEAAVAYEKAVELDPSDLSIWESLEGVYKELRNNTKMKQAQEKIKELTG